MISLLDDANFAAGVTNANRKVCVMFFADWAGPCHLARPMFEELAETFATDEYLFGVFDIGDNPMTPRDYGLRSVPCFMVFDRDVLTKSLTGAVSVSLIEPQVNEAYGHGRIWSVAWFGGPFGWAEAYAVSEGASNTALVTYALTPCVLAIEALD